jgi:hypothetical protein
VLARLDKIKGVEKTQANRAGTLVRISVAASADADKVAAAAAEVLTGEKRKAVRLKGADLERALSKETWYGPDELSAIEFRTLALRSIQRFAEAEELNKETTDKLSKIAEEEWDRLAKAAAAAEKRPGSGTDWSARCAAFATAFLGRARDVLSAGQLERLQKKSEDLMGGKPPKGRKE